MCCPQNETHTVKGICGGGFPGGGHYCPLGRDRVNERGYDSRTGRLLVDVNPEFYRPAEVEFLWGRLFQGGERTELEEKSGF